jgi:LysM repeat protein
MKTSALSLCFILFQFVSFGQPPPQKRITTQEYISLYKGDAIKDMMKMGVPASITIAQGILESESGNSDLAREAKNHFGIKCHKDWTGETFHKDDDAKDECFRKYKSVLESYDDHGRFLRERSRYAFLFDYKITDYKSWAHGLKKAGYATNPRYADLLIKLIEEHQLYQYDAGGKNIPVVPNSTPAVAVSPPVENAQPKHKKTVSAPHSSSKPGVMLNSREVPYVIAGNKDTWFTIAISQDMRLWQILKYNDASQNDAITPGSVVYLKPKRGNPEQEYHLVKDGETLWMLSQLYCVKLKKLIKLNQLESGVELQAGQKIKLR